MLFHVGQKIVCVNAFTALGRSGRAMRWPPGGEIFEGNIYTVREVGITVRGRPGVRLAETEHSCPPRCVGGITGKHFIDGFYRADRFRPLVERKTDISVFTAMLNRTTETVDA